MTKDPTKDRLVSIHVAAHRLGKTVAALRKKLQRGAMVPMPIKIDGRWQWRESDIDRYLATVSQRRRAAMERVLPGTASMVTH